MINLKQISKTIFLLFGSMQPIVLMSPQCIATMDLAPLRQCCRCERCQASRAQFLPRNHRTGVMHFGQEEVSGSNCFVLSPHLPAPLHLLPMSFPRPDCVFYCGQFINLTDDGRRQHQKLHHRGTQQCLALRISSFCIVTRYKRSQWSVVHGVRGCCN